MSGSQTIIGWFAMSTLGKKQGPLVTTNCRGTVWDDTRFSANRVRSKTPFTIILWEKLHIGSSSTKSPSDNCWNCLFGFAQAARKDNRHCDSSPAKEVVRCTA